MRRRSRSVSYTSRTVAFSLAHTTFMMASSCPVSVVDGCVMTTSYLVLNDSLSSPGPLTKLFVGKLPRSHDTAGDSPSDRRRTRHPPRAVVERAVHRAAGARRAGERTRACLYDGAEAAADHDGQGADHARAARPAARLHGTAHRAGHAAAAREGSPRSRVRRFHLAARDAGARHDGGDAWRAARDPAPAHCGRRPGQGEEAVTVT